MASNAHLISAQLIARPKHASLDATVPQTDGRTDGQTDGQFVS